MGKLQNTRPQSFDINLLLPWSAVCSPCCELEIGVTVYFHCLFVNFTFTDYSRHCGPWEQYIHTEVLFNISLLNVHRSLKETSGATTIEAHTTGHPLDPFMPWKFSRKKRKNNNLKLFKTFFGHHLK